VFLSSHCLGIFILQNDDCVEICKTAVEKNTAETTTTTTTTTKQIMGNIGAPTSASFSARSIIAP
jgi:hypothetical protein